MGRSLPYNEQLKRKRMAMGLNQRRMAVKADVDPAVISGLENASRSINVLSMVKIARAYEVDIEPLALFIAALQGYEE